MDDAVDNARDHRRMAAEKPPGAFRDRSNTGCMSASELAMTFRMSAVAVCRSSASLVSLNSRAFSTAITAWSANVHKSSMNLSVKFRFAPRDTNRANGHAFPDQRDPRRHGARTSHIFPSGYPLFSPSSGTCIAVQGGSACNPSPESEGKRRALLARLASDEEAPRSRG